MKRLFRLLLILGLAAGTWSCADDGTPSVSINGGTDFLSLDHLARSGKITVNAPAPWSVTLAPENYGQDEKPDWLTLSAEEGPAGYSEIDVTFAENPGPARSASLLFSCDGKTLAFTVSQSAGGTGFDAPDYYFYISVGTMPTLYSGLHLLSHDKPSYVSYERASTFDAAEFPDRAFVYPVADPTGHATNEELRAMSEAMKRRILEINAEDPTAVFGLWVDDLRCRLGYDWFVAQGIDSARVKVTMLSDGTATYNNFHNYFGDAATAEQNWNDYAAEVEALESRAVAAAHTAVFKGGVTVLVVLRLFLLVGEDGICLVDLFELLFRLFISRVDVGMILLCELVICFFDCGSVGVFIDAEHFIIVSLICHRSSLISLCKFVRNTRKIRAANAARDFSLPIICRSYPQNQHYNRYCRRRPRRLRSDRRSDLRRPARSAPDCTASR